MPQTGRKIDEEGEGENQDKRTGFQPWGERQSLRKHGIIRRGEGEPCPDKSFQTRNDNIRDDRRDAEQQGDSERFETCRQVNLQHGQGKSCQPSAGHAGQYGFPGNNALYMNEASGCQVPGQKASCAIANRTTSIKNLDK